MNSEYPAGHEKVPKRDDAAQLAELLYYSLDREHKVGQGDDVLLSVVQTEMSTIVDDIKNYIRFRAEQDPEMGQSILDTFESFRDPDPTLADLEPTQNMQAVANDVRETLGLPAQDLPTEPRVVAPPSDRPQ